MSNRKKGALAVRQEVGFTLESMPAITEQQFHWLSFRMGTDSDFEACTQSMIDYPTLEDWLTKPDFCRAYDVVLSNKREGFKFLITQLNGKVLRVIDQLLDSDSVRGQTQGVQLALRAQGLLIDKRNPTDEGVISALIDKLREQKPMISVTPAKPRKAKLNAGLADSTAD